jgi:tetratricopeptide (TPR) repeat protein
MKNIFLILSFVLISQTALAIPFSPYNYYATGMVKIYLMLKKYEMAQSEMLKALRRSPLQPELHLNLGIAQMGLGHLSRALGSFRMAEELAQDEGMKFMARFNQALVLTIDKKIPDALEMYQKALEIDPSSKEVKTNIELLMQQQQGQGQGEGEDQEKKDQEPKDGDESKDGKNQKEPQKFNESQSYKPKDEQENLSEGQIKKILEEIKRQEQQINNSEIRQKQMHKESANEKDW